MSQYPLPFKEQDIFADGVTVSMSISPPTLADKILKVMGKRRGVIIPTETEERFGPYVHSVATRESFWKALFRPKDAPLPEGVIDWEEFVKEKRRVS